MIQKEACELMIDERSSDFNNREIEINFDEGVAAVCWNLNEKVRILLELFRPKYNFRRQGVDLSVDSHRKCPKE